MRTSTKTGGQVILSRSSFILLVFIFISQTSGAYDLNSLDLGGDFRLRNEWISDETRDSDRLRQRLRGRISLKAPVNESVAVAFRLASGDLEITSRNQSFDGNSSAKGFNLDRAYFQWDIFDRSQLKGGKMAQPFYQPGKSEIMWDGDLAPEGLQFSFQKDKIEANLAGFWLDERSEAADAGLLATQLLFNGEFGASQLKAGIGYYYFAGLEGRALLADDASDTPDSKGNTAPGGVYAYDYKVSELFLDAHFSNSALPWGVYGGFYLNNEADADNQAFVIGINAGSKKNIGDTMLDYSYRRTEADALYASYTDSDFADGNTNSEGHQIKISYVLAEGSTMGIKYLASTLPLEDGRDYQRGQLDFVFKF